MKLKPQDDADKHAGVFARGARERRAGASVDDEAQFGAAIEAWKAHGEGGSVGGVRQKDGSKRKGAPKKSRRDGPKDAVPSEAMQSGPSEAAADSTKVAMAAIPSFSDIEPAPNKPAAAPRKAKEINGSMKWRVPFQEYDARAALDDDGKY
jgi:hypothetical protein